MEFHNHGYLQNITPHSRFHTSATPRLPTSLGASMPSPRAPKPSWRTSRPSFALAAFRAWRAIGSRSQRADQVSWGWTRRFGLTFLATPAPALKPSSIRPSCAPRRPIGSQSPRKPSSLNHRAPSAVSGGCADQGISVMTGARRFYRPGVLGGGLKRLAQEISRRDALGAGITVSVMTSLPAIGAAAATIGPDHPDAALFALVERCREADTLSDAALEAALQAWAQVRPEFPTALLWTEGDARSWFRGTPRSRLSSNDVETLRGWLKFPRHPDQVRDPELAKFPPLIPLQAFADRAAEIVRIWDEHEAAERAAKEHPSVLAAQAQQDETYRRWCELATRLATMPAKTSEGLIAKLALIASPRTPTTNRTEPMMAFSRAWRAMP